MAVRLVCLSTTLAFLLVGCGAATEGGQPAPAIGTATTPSTSESSRDPIVQRFAENVSIPIAEDGSFTWTSPAVPLEDPNVVPYYGASWHVEGQADVPSLDITPVDTPEGTVIKVEYEVRSVQGAAQLIIDAILGKDGGTRQE